MKLRNLSPAFVNFLAGIAAAGAVNLVTTIPSSKPVALHLAVVAVAWAAVAVSLAVAAGQLDDARRQADRLVTGRMGPRERAEIEERTAESVRSKVTWLLAAALVFVAVGVALWLALL